MNDVVVMPGAAPSSAVAERLSTFSMDIASGMLESLGLNMYTSIGKSLSEFVANAYDADATKVEIVIPFEQIEVERSALRVQAKAEVAAKLRDKFTVLVDPLPDTIQITITDDGHGMLPTEIRDKLLVVSRNRRKASQTSESGNRYVMGRKGLGKLAGFGTAQRITIRSKRAGETFATEFTMDYGLIETHDRVGDATFQAVYYEDLDVAARGTTVTLSGLRCDSLKASEETVHSVLAQNFAMLGKAFAVLLNARPVTEPPAEYEFIWPPEDQRDADGFGVKTVTVNDMLDFPIRYQVRFRARETDGDAAPAAASDADGAIAAAAAPVLARGSLPAARRGARIYCNNRLAAGPSMLNLPSGMHNFHSQAYMECLVHADEVDRQVVDHIGTNRADLKGDSEVVEALRGAITEVMRVSLYEHSKFRDKISSAQVEADPLSKQLLTRAASLSKDVRAPAKRLLQTLAASAGVKSALYQEAAPLVFDSMNAGEVLTKLMDLEHDPKSLPVLAHELLELARIENRDVLKLYRGRRRGIEGLRKLVDRARESWKKGERFENGLHLTLKENPWLIKPEFSRYLTSDKPLGDVAKQLNKVLKIDEDAPELKIDAYGTILDEDTRPDLVFVMSDAHNPTSVAIVELKTPNCPLNSDHLIQLETYMLNVEEYLKGKYQAPASVRGYLIGETDPTSKSEKVRLLNKKFAEAGPLSLWEIIPLTALLERAKKIHVDAIEVAIANEEFLDSELDTTPPAPAKVAPVAEPAAKSAAKKD